MKSLFPREHVCQNTLQCLPISRKEVLIRASEALGTQATGQKCLDEWCASQSRAMHVQEDMCVLWGKVFTLTPECFWYMAHHTVAFFYLSLSLSISLSLSQQHIIM